jgi:hypothetical protein
MEECGQLATVVRFGGGDEHHINVTGITKLIDIYEPDIVVMENYRVYKNKLDRHTNSDVPTLQLIGQIKYVCGQRNIPIALQMAAQAKGFADDNKLKQWNFWGRSVHARDAIRHGVYYLLFGGGTKQS